MRTFIYIAILISTITSCRQTDKNGNLTGFKNKWSSEQINKYFIDSIALRNNNGKFTYGDSLSDFDKFSKTFFSDIKAKNINDPLIYALEESYVDTTKIDSTKEWFRITVDPCFDIPYCIVAEKINESTKLTIKMTNGFGCYYSGYISFTNSQFCTDTVYKNVIQKLTDIDFWKLEKDTTCELVLDGESWTFESISKGQYQLINIHSPEACKSYAKKVLLSIADQLKEISRFNDFLNLKKQTMKKVFGEN